jgi:hypothetical protein
VTGRSHAFSRRAPKPDGSRLSAMLLPAPPGPRWAYRLASHPVLWAGHSSLETIGPKVPEGTPSPLDERSLR